MTLTYAQFIFCFIAFSLFLIGYVAYLIYKLDEAEKQRDYYRRHMDDIRHLLNSVHPFGNETHVVLSRADVADLKYFTLPYNFPHKSHTK